jgi:hypothetical protein
VWYNKPCKYKKYEQNNEVEEREEKAKDRQAEIVRLL